MKKIIFGLSLLMSIIGSNNSFGSTNKDKNYNSSNTSSAIINQQDVKHKDNHCRCKNCVRGENKHPRHHASRMSGGYTQQRKLTKQDKQLFKSTYNGRENLKPISVSTQVVNGTNYKFICKGKNGDIVTVIIYQSLPHHGSQTKVVSVTR